LRQLPRPPANRQAEKTYSCKGRGVGVRGKVQPPSPLPLSPEAGARGDCCQSLCLVTFDRKPFRFSCSSTARTTRKPTNSALVSHQMLRGRCGSSLIQDGSERRRTAQRTCPAGSSYEPPRTTCDQRFSVGSSTGDSVNSSAGNLL